MSGPRLKDRPTERRWSDLTAEGRVPGTPAGAETLLGMRAALTMKKRGPFKTKAKCWPSSETVNTTQ